MSTRLGTRGVQQYQVMWLGMLLGVFSYARMIWGSWVFNFARGMEVHSFTRVMEVFELLEGFVFALVMQVNSCTRMLGMYSEMLIFAKVMKVHSLNKVVQDEVYFAKDCA